MILFFFLFFTLTVTDLKLVFHISSSQYPSLHSSANSHVCAKSRENHRRREESTPCDFYFSSKFPPKFPRISHDENHHLPLLLPSSHLEKRRIHESFTVRFPGKKNTAFPPKTRNQTLTRGMRRLFPFAYKDVTPPIAPRCPFLVRPYRHLIP